MFIVHGTSLDNLFLILKEGEIKSNYLTGKINIGWGYGGPHKYIYFHLERKLFADTNFYRIKLYFSPELLDNRNFYLSTDESAVFEENFNSKWTDQGIQQLKKKYKKNTKNISKILDKFYFYNYMIPYWGSVAIKNRFDISKYLVAVEFITNENELKDNKKYDKIINLLNKKYPNVIIKNQVNEDSDYLLKNANKETKYIINKNKNKNKGN